MERSSLELDLEFAASASPHFGEVVQRRNLLVMLKSISPFGLAAVFIACMPLWLRATDWLFTMLVAVSACAFAGWKFDSLLRGHIQMVEAEIAELVTLFSRPEP